MSQEFTLKDVLSDRIYDEEVGWRDRLPHEYVVLNDAQKESFLEVFGKGCRQRTKGMLEQYIGAPYAPVGRTWWLERVSWVGDKCQYCAGQDYPYEIAQIRKFICG